MTTLSPGQKEERDALYRSVLASPRDLTPRRVMADWYRENGNSERADFIQASINLWQMQEERRDHEPLHYNRNIQLFEPKQFPFDIKEPRNSIGEIINRSWQRLTCGCYQCPSKSYLSCSLCQEESNLWINARKYVNGSLHEELKKEFEPAFPFVPSILHGTDFWCGWLWHLEEYWHTFFSCDDHPKHYSNVIQKIPLIDLVLRSTPKFEQSTQRDERTQVYRFESRLAPYFSRSEYPYSGALFGPHMRDRLICRSEVSFCYTLIDSLDRITELTFKDMNRKILKSLFEDKLPAVDVWFLTGDI